MLTIQMELEKMNNDTLLKKGHSLLQTVILDSSFILHVFHTLLSPKKKNERWQKKTAISLYIYVRKKWDMNQNKLQHLNKSMKTQSAEIR